MIKRMLSKRINKELDKIELELCHMKKEDYFLIGTHVEHAKRLNQFYVVVTLESWYLLTEKQANSIRNRIKNIKFDLFPKYTSVYEVDNKIVIDITTATGDTLLRHEIAEENKEYAIGRANTINKELDTELRLYISK